MPRIAAALLVAAAARAAGQPSDKCQAAADAFCATDCYPKIKDRPCDGPMYARQSGPDPTEWRCYSPSTLSGNKTYDSGTCYCSRDAELKDVLSGCASGLVSARVFSDGDAGACYRIPAVVQARSGVLVAFAEARHGGCGDGEVHEIAVSRSTDSGVTWSPARFAAGSAAFPVGNPYPFALSDGRVALVFVNHTQGSGGVGPGNGIVFSSDDGVSWSSPREISAGFGSAKGSMPGPGAGVQLSGSGRLLIVSHYGAYVDDYITYSDDMGATWTTIDHKFPGMDEATLADLGGGKVLLNFRHRDEKSLGRGVARSNDSGLTWSGISYDSALIGPVCQGSLAAVGPSVYFSNPASTSGRNHVTVRRSDDGGATWGHSYLVQEGSSAGYSSLVQGTVGDSAHGGLLLESTTTGCIDFKTFPLSMPEAGAADIDVELA